MSHVATVDLDVTDLGVLAAACRRIGLEFVEGQQTYRWYGQSMGDGSIPAGFTAEDLGRCEHAIRLADGSTRGRFQPPYEIGVVRRRDGRPGWALLLDEWQGGYGLIDVCGQGAGTLKQAYALEQAICTAQQQGYQVQERQLEDGSIQLLCQR